MVKDEVTLSDETVKIGLAIAEFINSGGNDASDKLKKVNRREIRVNRRKNKRVENNATKNNGIIL